MPDFSFDPVLDNPGSLSPPPPPFKPDPVLDDPVGTFVQSKALAGADFADVRPVLEQAGLNPDQAEGRYKLDRRRAYEAQRQETAQEFLAKRVFPFASAIGNAAQEARYKRVMDQVNAGTVPSDADAEFAARHEHLQQFKAERQQTLLGGLAEAGAGLPALMGEAALTRLPGLGMGKGLLANTARSVGQAPLMPSLYAEQAAENATRKGGEPTDFKNLAPPLAMAAVQNVVLGRLQARAAGSTVPTAAGRLAYAGALGVGEQAGLDVAASAVDETLPDSLKTETKYGVLGDLARGLASGRPDNKAVTHATVQALTFAAFAAAHGRPHEPVIKTFTAAADALHDAGVPAEAAGPVLADAVERVQTAPDKAAAEKALESLPDGPLKDYVKEAVLPTLTTEKRVADVGPPEGTDERRGMHLRAEAADAAAKFVDEGHGPAVLVDMDVNNMKGLDARFGTEAARRHVEAMVEIVRSELAAVSGKAEAFRHAGDAQGDEHSAVVLHLDKANANAALARAQAKIDAYAREHGFADLPHAKGGDRLPGAGLTTFAEPFVKGRGWKETATEAEAGTETLKQRRIRPTEPPPEPVRVTESPQPQEPQRLPLKIADLTLGQTKVAALAAGLPHLGPVDALKRSLVKALGENLPERLRAAVEGTPPVAIKRDLPGAGPEGLRRAGEPGLGAPAAPPGPPLVENVHPAVARARLRQAKLEAHGLVPKPQPGPDVGQGQGLARFNEPAMVPKLSPKQHRGRAWVKLELAGQQAEALRERAGGVVGDQLGRAGDRPPELPDAKDPNAWKLRVLRDRLLSGRQLISDAMKDPTPEKVTAALGAVESIRRATEANGERGRSLRDKAFPGWAEVEKRFTPEPPAANEFGLRPLKASEPVTVTGKLKPARTPEEVAAANARRIANLKQNKTAITWPGEIRNRGGISPESAAEYWDPATFRTAGGKLKQQFLDKEGRKSTRHIDNVLDELVNDKLMVPNERQHRSDQLLEMIQGKGPSPAGLESKAGQQQFQNAINDHYRQEALDEFHAKLKNDNPSWSDAEIERAGAELLAEAERRGLADAAGGDTRSADEFWADAGGDAAGALGRDQLRAAGGGAGREHGGHPEVPDAAAEADHPDAQAADGGVDLSWDVGKLDAESAADRLLSEQVRSNQERAAELPLPEAMGAASAGFTARLGKDAAAEVRAAAVRLVHRVQDFADRLAGGGMTRTARLSQAAADAGEAFAGKRIYAQELAPHLLDKVMPGSGSMADRLLFGATFAEERLRHMRELNRKEAMAASAEGVKALRAGDRAKAAEWFQKADAASKAMRKVISLVGKTFADPSIPYPLPDEAAYRRAVADPKYKERMARHVKDVVPVMEEAFRKAQGMEETDPIHGPTQLPGRPVSLIGKKPGEETPTTVLFTGGTARGNLIGHRLRRLGAARMATGAAEHGYELDYGAVVERMLSDRLPLAAKAEVYRTLEQEGLGVWRKPGEKYDPHGLPFKALPDVNPPRGTQTAGPNERNFLVHPDAYGELRQLFGVDEPLPRTPWAGALTVASIASGAEVLPHARNLLSMMTRPGYRFSDVYRGVRGELTGDPAIQRELLELARIGALKERGFENASFKAAWNPLTYASKALDVVDRAMRFAATKAYDRLAERDGVEKSDRARRQFVNQLGNYSKLTQNKLVAMLRDTGFGPFATAASNWWMQSLRGNLLVHGVRTTSRSADLRLRSEMLLRMAAVPATVAALNYVLNGRVDGDDDTPLGALKVGTHNGRTVYLDLTALTGVTRGLRETGLLALAENKRPGARARGATTGDAMDAALRDIVTGVAHPAMGPPAAFVDTALTGKNTLGTNVAPQAAPGESKSLMDLYAAVWQMNPNVESFARPWVDRQLGLKPVKREESLGEKGLKLLGPYGPKFSGGPPGQPHRTEETPRPTREQRLLRPGK